MLHLVKEIREYCKEEKIPLKDMDLTFLVLNSWYKIDWFTIWDTLRIKDTRDTIEQKLYELAGEILFPKVDK